MFPHIYPIYIYYITIIIVPLIFNYYYYFIIPSIEHFNINQSDLDNGLQWIGLYSTGSCKDVTDADYQTLYVTLWEMTMSLSIKNTGAVGFINYGYGPANPYWFYWSALDGVDINQGIHYVSSYPFLFVLV